MREKFARIVVGFILMSCFVGCGKSTDQVADFNDEVISNETIENTNTEMQTTGIESLDDAIYIGEYFDYDNNEPNLEIAKGNDGKYIVQIGIFRLTTLSDGIGELTPEGMLFTATDATGNPISGIITVENQIATVKFTDSTWSLLESGSVFQYSKSSDTPNVWSE